MARGKTHKRTRKIAKIAKITKTRSVMTIPSLRKSLDYIARYGGELAQSGKTAKESATSFASEWKKTFGKPLSLESAERYIQHLTGIKTKKKTRKIRGGGITQGAPIDYLTRPGLEIPYGKFLPYVSAGFWNPEPAIQADYGKQQPILPYPETGSNRMSGGGFLDSISFRPFTAQNPPSIQNDATATWKGQPLGPGGNSYDRAYQYQMSPSASVPSIVNSVYTRTLANDVQP